MNSKPKFWNSTRCRWIVAIIALFAFYISSCNHSSNSNQIPITNTTYMEGDNFFVPVAIVKFSSTFIPCIEVQIEDKNYTLRLDLGGNEDLSLEAELIDQIASKTFLRKSSIFGIRGKTYPISSYQLSKLKIGDMVFLDPILKEQNKEWDQDSNITKGSKRPSREFGQVGWRLFCNSNLLLDLKNSQIAFCNSLVTLRKQGYPIEKFTKVPLLLDRGFIEFEAKTSEGSMRLMLDTGCTPNLIHREMENEKSLEEIAADPSNFLKNASLEIAEKEFGPIGFHFFPIKYPFQVDAILGMDFFRDHLVFIDFKEKQIYFSKYEDIH